MYIQGYRIRQRRKQLDLSQEQLAAMVRAQQKQISMWERGETEPSTDMVYMLATEMKVSVDWLYGLSDFMLPSGDMTLTAPEREALEIIRSKPADQQAKIVNVLKALA